MKWDLLSGVIHTPELPTGSCQFGGELSEIMSTLTLFPFPSQSCLLLCWFLLGNTWDTLICVRLFVTPWTVARQAPLSMRFSRQEHWSGLPCPPPGDLPDPRLELSSLTVSCIGRWVLYNEPHLGSLVVPISGPPT